jgi:membrane-associated phospholipid phosphatase
MIIKMTSVLSIICSALQDIDLDLLARINLNRPQSLDMLFGFITDSVTPITISILVLMVMLALFKKSKVNVKRAVIIGVSLSIAGIVSTSLKYSIKRERPWADHSFIQKLTDGGGYSFPSGHTTSAFALAVAICFTFSIRYLLPCLTWALAVGFSRMVLGVHYPSDVLAGVVIGSGAAFLSNYAYHWFDKRSALKKNS